MDKKQTHSMAKAIQMNVVEVTPIATRTTILLNVGTSAVVATAVVCCHIALANRSMLPSKDIPAVDWSCSLSGKGLTSTSEPVLESASVCQFGNFANTKIDMTIRIAAISLTHTN